MSVVDSVRAGSVIMLSNSETPVLHLVDVESLEVIQDLDDHHLESVVVMCQDIRSTAVLTSQSNVAVLLHVPEVADKLQRRSICEETFNVSLRGERNERSDN